MRRSVKSFLTFLAAVVMGCLLLAPVRPLAQDSGGGQTAADDTANSGASTRDAASGGEGRALQPGSTRPPKNLKKVGDHWTPYDPPDPESFPAGAPVHVIVRGDTLWDLADLTFGDPYLWPQIWNENRYILDSHWIYPGDPIVLPARPTVVTEVVPLGQAGAPPLADTPPRPQEEETEDLEPAPVQETLTAEGSMAEDFEDMESTEAPETAHAPRTVKQPVPHADEVDIRCSGFIARKDSKPDYFIANQEEEGKVGITENDIIYLNRGSSNGHVDPGTEYSIVVREGEVIHPITHKRVGFYFKRLGAVKVLAAQEMTAIATVSMACDEIRTGYDLVPLKVEQLPTRHAPPFHRFEPLPEGRPSGYIIHTMDHLKVAGTGYIVEIDLGYEDGVKPGDFLAAYLPNAPYDKYRNQAYNFVWGSYEIMTPEERHDNKNVYPAKNIAQLIVLTTEKNTATAKIINSIREIEIGTPVQLY